MPRPLVSNRRSPDATAQIRTLSAGVVTAPVPRQRPAAPLHHVMGSTGVGCLDDHAMIIFSASEGTSPLGGFRTATLSARLIMT
jgi:hypothetical protein